MAREYTDKFTLDGRVQVVPGVTQEKVGAVKGLMERHLRNDGIASARRSPRRTRSSRPRT